MSVTARVRNYLNYTGDQESEQIFDSGDLANSPCIQELKSFSSGNNVVLLPDVDDFVVHGFALIPPSLNDVEPVLKGIAGDTGITLSASQVSVIQLGATLPASIVISVGEAVSGFRLIWF